MADIFNIKSKQKVDPELQKLLGFSQEVDSIIYKGLALNISSFELAAIIIQRVGKLSLLIPDNDRKIDYLVDLYIHTARTPNV